MRGYITIWCFLIFGSSFLGTQLFAQNDIRRHGTGLDDQWLSCSPNMSPNPVRGNSHWIMYDLGDTYALSKSVLWNFNTPERINSYGNEPWSVSALQGTLDDGLRDIIIDLSDNGTVWQEWGRFSLPKGQGSGHYLGESGPDFNGKTARFVLITAMSNHGGACYGLGEVKIDATIATVSSGETPFTGVQFSVFPNPANDKTTLHINDLPSGEYSISLIDMQGRLMNHFSADITQSAYAQVINTSGLVNGLYFVNISNGQEMTSLKFEVLH